VSDPFTFTSREDRLRATWDKRLQLFGEDAKVIWAAQLQQEQVETALKQLDTPSLPLAAKVDSYVQTLVEVYGPDARNPDRSHPVQQMEGLLSLASVQDQLHQMTPEQRRDELHHLRTALGLDAEAVKRWDELDAERHARGGGGGDVHEGEAGAGVPLPGRGAAVAGAGLAEPLVRAGGGAVHP
jgi:hypothetical protein